MAIYHLRAKVIQRSQGQSAVKSASYRHGTRLRDERLGRSFHYRKPDVVHSAILAPEGAPEWVQSRYELWNRAEAVERRDKAQTAREIELTLPRELDRPAQIALVCGFMQEYFVSRGMVADIAIHAPLGADGLEQPHAHVMLTMRHLDDSTSTGFAKTKAREWNEDPKVEAALREAKAAFRQNETPELEAQVEALDKQRNIHVWRAGWSEHVNRALADADVAARVDHRTLAAQGIAREPQPFFGIARHVEAAYGVLKERLDNWLSVLKRNELYRAFAPYQKRDATQFAHDVSAITAFTDQLLSHWRQRPWENQKQDRDVGGSHDR